MDISIRRAEQRDLQDIVRQDGASFGISYTPQDIDDALLVLDLDRFWVATAEDRIVGVAGDYPLTMTTPGGRMIDVPGVTWVSVSPTHRRRGILSKLMHHQLRDYADRGEALAVLTASEGAIYRRFGYGPATRVRRTVIDRRTARLLPASREFGPVELVSAEHARKLLPELHRRWRSVTPGAVNRTDGRWELHLLDREQHRDGMSARQYLVHADGYIGYRIKDNWADGHPQHLLWITDYATVTPDAHQALWRVLLGFDLVGTIESYQLPVDDPLPLLLTDGRMLRTTVLNDGVWVRPLDIPAALRSRSYAVEFSAVLRVSDPLLGDGTFRLTGGPDGVECVPTNAPADVNLSVDALGSMYLGGERLLTLAAAGLVQADDDRLLARLDRAFLGDRAPFHGTAF